MSDAFNSQFTSDGKINFKARIGMDKSKDPFKLENYDYETFNDHESKNNSVNFRSINLDEEELNEEW